MKKMYTKKLFNISILIIGCFTLVKTQNLPDICYEECYIDGSLFGTCDPLSEECPACVKEDKPFWGIGLKKIVACINLKSDEKKCRNGYTTCIVSSNPTKTPNKTPTPTPTIEKTTTPKPTTTKSSPIKPKTTKPSIRSSSSSNSGSSSSSSDGKPTILPITTSKPPTLAPSTPKSTDDLPIKDNDSIINDSSNAAGQGTEGKSTGSTTTIFLIAAIITGLILGVIGIVMWKKRQDEDSDSEDEAIALPNGYPNQFGANAVRNQNYITSPPHSQNAGMHGSALQPQGKFMQNRSSMESGSNQRSTAGSLSTGYSYSHEPALGTSLGEPSQIAPPPERRYHAFVDTELSTSSAGVDSPYDEGQYGGQNLPELPHNNNINVDRGENMERTMSERSVEF